MGALGALPRLLRALRRRGPGAAGMLVVGGGAVAGAWAHAGPPAQARGGVSSAASPASPAAAAPAAAAPAATAPAAAAPATAPAAAAPATPGANAGGALSTLPYAAPIRPSATEPRSLTCPVSFGNESPVFSFRGRAYEYRSAAQARVAEAGWTQRIRLERRALDGLVPEDTPAMLIDVRRVRGEPVYAYYGQGALERTPYEPWSSSKVFAAAAALARVRQESGGLVGGDGRVGRYAVADLVTALHAYAPVGEVTAHSNALGAFFLLTAGAEFTSQLFGAGWLRLDGDESRFRGTFGVLPFDPETTAWSAPDGTLVERPLSREGLTGEKGMSALAQAEWLRRLVMHETEPAGRMPGLTAADVETLLYGSAQRPGEAGGMSAGVSTYLAAALTGATTYDDARSALARVAGPRWRLFHKVGWGDSASRNRSEVVTVGYACLPELDGGRELVVALRTSLAGTPGVAAAGEAHQAALKAVLQAALAPAGAVWPAAAASAAAPSAAPLSAATPSAAPLSAAAP